MVFFLALRNIARNIKNSSIIALLIAIITFLFFIGNSVIERADRTMRQSYIESLTGDVVVQKTEDVSMNFFGANNPVIDNYFNIPVLPAYDLAMEIVTSEPGIAGITSIVSGRTAFVLREFEPALLCGVNPDTYFRLFPGIILKEGRFLQPGEYGAMITTEWADRIAKETGKYPTIGRPLLLTAAGEIGFKIREIPLVGIFSYKNPGPYMSEIMIVDQQTVRVLNSIQVAGGAEAGENDTNLLGVDGVNIDDIFGERFIVGAIDGDNDENEFSGAEFSADMLISFLRESKSLEINEETGGDYNFIIISLEKGTSVSAFIKSLNKKIEGYGLVAVDWRTAAGSFAIMMLLLQALFNAGIFLVSVVCVIAAINILLITVFRRTGEIGTLRAIGASDSYIRSLIFTENFVISMTAGFTGILGGFLTLKCVNTLEIRIPNNLIASLLGGPVLQIDFLPHMAAFSFVVAVVLGLAASLYPVEAAVRIQPMAAVRRG